MKILSMTATFGKLERETLRLEDGLNILQLPNEGGKSTWCAFLLAMFYGVDTSERASKGSLPVKTKYRPWSGSAMEGRMELLWQGRRITVERRSRGRIPMGDFSAYESESGLPVRELTAENCGLVLLGAPKAVYERSAWVKQSDLQIGQHGALEQRLAALVASGEETVSYSQTEKRLRERKNGLRHHKTGELPRLERELEETEGTLRQLHGLRDSVRESQAAEEAIAADLLRIERLERQKLQAEEAILQQQKRQAEDALRQTRARCEQARAQAAGIPEEAVLRERQSQWAELQQARRGLHQNVAAAPEAPVLPEALSGKTEEESKELLRQALWNYDAWKKAARKEKQPLMLLPLLLVLAAAALLALRLWAFGAAALVFTAVTLAVLLRSAAAAARERKAALRAAEDLLRYWGEKDRQELQQLSARTGAVLARYELEQQQYQQALEARQKQEDALRQREQAFLAVLEALLPGAAKEPYLAIGAALEQRRKLAELERETADAARYASLLATRGAPSEETAAALHSLQTRKTAAEEQLRQIRSRMDHDRGQITAMGDPAALEAERERLQARIAEKQEQYEALQLAMETLDKANGILQTQYAPEISCRAAAVMARMTGGKYDRVLLDPTLHASLREHGAVISHGAEELSRGTADQLYLAVRLAICQTALPKDVPLILDDVLVNFDDRRAAEAVALLREEAKKRQILLFTCQNREKTF